MQQFNNIHQSSRVYKTILATGKTYHKRIETTSSTRYVTSSFRLFKGVRIGQTNARRIKNHHVFYEKEVRDSKIELISNPNGTENLRFCYGAIPFNLNATTVNQYCLTAHLAGHAVIKNISENKCYVFRTSFSEIGTLRNAIYRLEQNGVSFKRIAIAKKLPFILLAILPNINFFWLHRLMSNGAKTWAILMAVTCVLYGILTLLKVDNAYVLVTFFPILDGLIAFFRKQDNSGYLDVSLPF